MFDSAGAPGEGEDGAAIEALAGGERGVEVGAIQDAAGTVGDLTTTVLIAGDDADAKSVVAGIVTSGGLKAIDAGPIERARELEAIGFLQITLAAAEKVSWTGGFGVVS